jgi:hypothetical protein
MRYANSFRHPEETFCSVNVSLVRLAVRVRGTVDYGFDAIHGLFETRLGQQVDLDGAGSSAPAEHPNVVAGGA